jgi:integrase
MRLFDPSAPADDRRGPTPRALDAYRRRRAREYRASVCVGEVVDLYLRHCRVRHVHTQRAGEQVEHYLGLFVRQHGHLPVIQLRPFHLTDFVCANPEWKAPGTRRFVAAKVKAVFGWAVEEERVRRNPFRSVQFPESERKPEMTDDLWLQLCRLASKPFEQALRFLRYTGCREGELCPALVTDVDAASGLWVVDRHKGRKHTKRAKVVELVPDAVELLRQVARPATGKPCHCPRAKFTEHQTNGHLLLNTRDRPWTPNTLQVTLIRLRDKVDFPRNVTLHSIRHRYATAGIAAGATTELVAKNLGHDPATCSKYYVDLSGQREAVRAAALLCQPPKK